MLGVRPMESAGHGLRRTLAGWCDRLAVFFAGHGHMPMSVQGIRDVVKPLRDLEVLDVINSRLEQSCVRDASTLAHDGPLSRLGSSLTDSNAEVRGFNLAPPVLRPSAQSAARQGGTPLTLAGVRGFPPRAWTFPTAMAF
jgi:hypothetical protein